MLPAKTLRSCAGFTRVHEVWWKVETRTRMRRASLHGSGRVAVLATLAVLAHAWPSDLLKDGCAKGVLLVEGGFTPPPIMGALPELDLSILKLRLVRSDAEDEDDDARPYDGRPLQSGEALELTYSNPRQKPFGVHLVFIASSGSMEDSVPCGDAGAILRCSTCGDTHQWLRSVVWTPTREGVTKIAVGAARGSYGTPAVHVATVNVSIGPLSARTAAVESACAAA